MDDHRKAPRIVLSLSACTATFALSSMAAWADARPDDDSRNWFGDFSIGYGYPQGDAGDLLDDDWILSGGATYWPAEWNVGLDFNLTWAQFDLTDSAVSAINTAIVLDPNNSGTIDGGDVESWQLTVNAIWGPGSQDHGFYLTGGIGAYYLKGEVTTRGLVYFPPFCDPWYWWWCVPGGVGVGSVPAGSDSTTEFGYNLGLGYSFDVGDGELFVEAKYHFVSTDTEDLEYTPLNFGFRW